MKPPLLSVEKVEFNKVSVEANPGFDGQFSVDLKKLDYNFKGSKFYRTVSLGYPEDQSDDPRFFSFTMNLVLSSEHQNPEVILPYSVDVKATAYMRYTSDRHQGEARFTAVRATGYAILYGAIREMVSNLTARGPHGLWMLPAADFNEAAKEEAVQDEADRLPNIPAAKKTRPKKAAKEPTNTKSPE